MDYFKGSIDAPREALIDRWFEVAGPNQRGNSLFAMVNFYDMIDDSRYVCLELSRFKQFVADYNKYRIWRKNKRDCDTRTRGLGTDLSDAMEELGVKGDGSLGCWDLGYDSKSLSRNPEERLAGYHSACICWTYDPVAKNFFPFVVQPKTLWDSGSKKEAQWQNPADEILFWVYIKGNS